ncbi:MAG: N-6 DNA methylase, partial [Planctomycetaceae bacterium]|nr:N-6 DNA methylase [Planctomycetaceae bacterium]
FFEKGKPTKDIWYYEHPYPAGQKSYNKTNPIRIEEFEAEKKWWKKRKASEFAWKVSVKEIIEAGYNLDQKNPHSADTGPGDPDELLQQFQELQTQVDATRNQLKAELAKSLGGK